MRKSFSGLLVAILVLVSTTATADVVVMQNGSRIIGTLVSAGGGKIVLNTDFAGDISIDSALVESVNTDTGATLLMKDGSVYRDKQINATQGMLTVTRDDNSQVEIAMAELDKVNPAEWELGNGYNFFGKVGAALLLEGGNTDNQELDVNYEVTYRSLEDRYSSKGYYEFDEANNVKNKDKWRMINKYDRFRNNTTDDYIGFLLAFESDEFANNDLRTYVGPYVGRQFYDSNLLDLQGEIGLVYVDETYIDDTEDYDYAGANWGLRITSDWISSYLGEDSQLFVDHDGIANFDDMDGLILNTTIGFSAPLIGGLEFGADLRFEYDGGVADDVEKTDTTFNFRLGYAW